MRQACPKLLVDPGTGALDTTNGTDRSHGLGECEIVFSVGSVEVAPEIAP
ncbi:MAG TPA: hypothetical protein VKT83_17775 [bacterium]|nr:hypothetical protein [bacterium]